MLPSQSPYEMNPAENERAVDMASGLDLNDAQTIAQFGGGVQNRLADASSMLLNRIQGERPEGDAAMEEMLALVGSLDISPLEVDIGFMGRLLGKRERDLNRLNRGFEDVAGRMDRLTGELDMLRMRLLKDIGIYDQLYNRNLQHLRDLEISITAGQMALDSFRANTLRSRAKEAANNDNSIVRQALSEAQDNAERFEKKLHDLKLSRMVALQMAPQIRLIQNNNRALADRMQQTITQTIPLWKNQMTLAISMARQQRALKTQRALSKTAGEAIRRNAQALGKNTREIAQEANQGVAALEDLKAAEKALAEVVNSALAIQQQGREQRQQEEQELVKVEAELKRSSAHFT